MDKPKILFIVDVPNWAFDFRAKKWQQLLSDKFDIDILYLKDNENIKSSFFKVYDGYVFFFYKAIKSKVLQNINIPLYKTAVCINSEKWRWEGSNYAFNRNLKGVKLLIGCNNNIVKEFSKYHNNIIKVTQCVDDSIFYPIDFVKKSNKKMKIGWCGNSNTPEKNIQYLITACDGLSGIELDIQTKLSQQKLNLWYNTLDLIVCVSNYEGGPNMLLEAGACKIPVITPQCGISDELIQHNYSGFIIPHNRLEVLIKSILILKKNSNLRKTMSDNLYNEVKSKWTYEKKLPEITHALNKLIEKDIL